MYYQDFGVLPDVAKRYITIRAARIYADRMLTPDNPQDDCADEQTALMDLKEYEGDTADYNMMQSYSVARVLNRGFNRRVPNAMSLISSPFPTLCRAFPAITRTSIVFSSRTAGKCSPLLLKAYRTTAAGTQRNIEQYNNQWFVHPLNKP